MKFKLVENIVCLGLIPLLLSCSPSQLKSVLAQPFKSEVRHNLKQVVITLQRGQCLGQCPVYKLTIYGTGKAVYEGQKYVSTIGKKEYLISQEQVKQLVSEFDKARFFSLQNDYTGGPTDAPSTITSINIDGRTKTVDHYSVSPNAPKELSELENKIDSIVGSPN